MFQHLSVTETPAAAMPTEFGFGRYFADRLFMQRRVPPLTSGSFRETQFYVAARVGYLEI